MNLTAKDLLERNDWSRERAEEEIPIWIRSWMRVLWQTMSKAELKSRRTRRADVWWEKLEKIIWARETSTDSVE